VSLTRFSSRQRRRERSTNEAPEQPPPPGLGPVDPNASSIDQVTYEADQAQPGRTICFGR
jgi:hypothetical protein